MTNDGTPHPPQAAHPAGPFEDPAIEALVSPLLGELRPNTSLSPLAFDLNAGVPDRSSLPARELAEAAAAALAEAPAEALTYGGQQGFEPLREWIALREASRSHLVVAPEHVTLTSGSAHGIDNVAAAFLAPGDVVAIGAPSYPGAIRAFKARGAELVELAQDLDGLDPADAERVFEGQGAAGRPVKLLYLIPTYDNPTGATIPLERRRELVDLAARHGALIVEDEAYAGLDFDGPPPPSLFALAEGRRVIQLGTFSKTVATGLRVGWTLAEASITRALLFARFDNGASPFLHRLVLHYLEHGGYEAHVQALQAIYRERRDASTEALREHLNGVAEFHAPAGGFFHWLHLREGLDAWQVTAAAAERGVAVTPGPTYYATAGGEREVRLAFPALPPDDLHEAIARLGVAIAELG
jgi:2-aminoadipate transaminase